MRLKKLMMGFVVLVGCVLVGIVRDGDCVLMKWLKFMLCGLRWVFGFCCCLFLSSVFEVMNMRFIVCVSLLFMCCMVVMLMLGSVV